MMPKPITLIDCSLRDGHQSLLATRMSTEQAMRVLPMLTESGYTILELWGGATLDSCLRFTNDDPFERLDLFRKTVGDDIQIRSLCRGQNLFGYTPYADEAVYSFIKEAVRSGNDRVRIFDALNDPRNLVTAIMAVKTFNGHAEAALSYTTSPVHDLDMFVRFAEQAIDSGADSIAIKDMAGLLHPEDCFRLVAELKKRFPGVYLTLHSHCTNGLACATYVAAMLAGIDALDTAHGPMAGGTSQPPVELMHFFAQVIGRDDGLDTKHFAKIDEELRKIRQELKDADAKPEYYGNLWPTEANPELVAKMEKIVELLSTGERAKMDEAVEIMEDQIMAPQGYAPTDRTQLDAQVPGGMISNLHKQLKDQGKLDLLPKILDEVPLVRADTGYVPLVTPTSQIVGTQASFNVMSGGRYKMVNNEFKNLVLGKYGRPPGTPSAEVIAKCSEDGKTYQERPAAYAPKLDMDQLAAEGEGLAKTTRDFLLLMLFPEPAKAFFRKRK